MKCIMCAQTRPFDKGRRGLSIKVTIFLTPQCPAEDQTNWMMRIQQLKNEMDVEQQERAGDIRSLLGLEANTPRPKEKEEEATPRRSKKRRSENRKSNRVLTKRETEAAQKRQGRLELRAKMYSKGLTRERERDFHWIAVEEEVLRCEICGKTKILDKATVMSQQRDCETRRLVGEICDKLNRESNDGEERPRGGKSVTKIIDLFEQTDRAEEAVATAARGMDQGTERAEHGHFGKSKGGQTPHQRKK